MQTIRTPDGQVFKFPDTMTRAQIAEALKRRLGNQTVQQPAQEKDRSFLGALRYGLDAPLENLAETADALGYKKTGDFLSNLTDAPENYDPASAAFINEGGSGFNFKELPRAAVEQAGQFAGSVASRAGGAAVGAALTGGNPIGAIVGGVAAPALFEGLQQLGGIANERARNNGREVPNREDWIGAISGASGTGILNAIAPNLGGLLKRAVVEGGTEAIQSIIQQVSETAATDKGLEVSPKQAVGEGIIGSGSVAAVDAPVGTVRKVKSVFTKDNKLVDLNDLSSSEKQAGADVARLLRALSEAEGYNLRDTNVSSDKGGKRALEAARRKIIERLRVLKGDEAVKRFLSPKERESFDQLIDDFAPAGGAFRAANNKVSDRVTQEQYDAVMRLLPESKEKQEIANLLRMSNQVTDLFNRGLKGGISQYTDHFNPFIKDGSYDPSRLTNLALGFGSALTLGAPTTAAIVGGGRAADFVTGRRAAAVDRFVRSNENKEGLPQPEGESLIEQQARREQEDADADAELATVPQDELDTSPIGTILNGTGLGQRGLEIVLNELETTYPDNKSLQKSIESTRKNLAGGNNKIFKSTRLVGILNRHINDNPDLQSLREALPDRLLSQRGINVQTDMPTMGGGGSQFGAQFTTPENYRRGIQDNLDFVRTLQDGAGKDKKLSKVDRGRLITSLENLTNNLGSNPVETVQTEVQKLQDQGVNQDAIDTYVKPYVDRVVRQQRPKDLQAAADAGVAPEFDTSGLSERDARLINMTDEEIAADASIW